MFRCQLTGKTTKACEKMHKVVIETRDKVYFEKRYVDGHLENVEVGVGYETVKEICVGDEGLRILEEQENFQLAK